MSEKIAIEFVRHGLVAINSTYLSTGDVSGYIMSIYTDVVGEFFLGVIMLVIFGGLYIRTQSLIFPALVWIICGSALEVALPTGSLSFGKALIIIAIAVVIYQLFMGQRD